MAVLRATAAWTGCNHDAGVALALGFGGMVRIRPLAAIDIHAADGVLCAAFGTEQSFAARMHRYLTIQPHGWLVAEEGSEIVGMVGAVDYGRFAYVGMMGVRPDRQGHGVGGQLLGALLDRLDRRGVACARLESTDAGRPLYLRHGFTDAGVTHEFHRAAEGQPASGGADGVEVATDLAEIVALDRALFGADRTRLWQWLFAAEPGGILVAREGGEVAGYLCVQADTLGPFGARTPGAAAALLRAAAPLIRSSRTRVMMPEQNLEGRAVLEAHAWTLQKIVPHLSRGPCPAPGWESIYGKGSYCLG
jgi:predicted N-acetyltransferase YhbS